MHGAGRMLAIAWVGGLLEQLAILGGWVGWAESCGEAGVLSIVE